MIVVWNMQNFGLSCEEMARMRVRLEVDLTLAPTSPLTFATLLLGDWNFLPMCEKQCSVAAAATGFVNPQA